MIDEPSVFFIVTWYLQPCAQWHKSWSIDISAKVVIAFDRPWPSMGVSREVLNFRWEFEVVCTIVKNPRWCCVYNIIGLCLRLTFDVAHHPVTNDITSVSSTQLDMLRFYWIHESNDLDLYIYNRSCWEIFTISKIICIHDIDNRSIYRYIYQIYMYIGLGLSSAIAILRSGFIRCCQMALRVVEDGLLHGGPTLLFMDMDQ